MNDNLKLPGSQPSATPGRPAASAPIEAAGNHSADDGLIERLTRLARKMQERIQVEPLSTFSLMDIDVVLDAAVALTRPLGEGEEALDMARSLIQEAKGAEGPNGGFVTNHLDAAEGWLDKVEAALRSTPSQAEETLRTLNIRGIALVAIRRSRQAGESQEMLARWISEDIYEALGRQS